MQFFRSLRGGNPRSNATFSVVGRRASVSRSRKRKNKAENGRAYCSLRPDYDKFFRYLGRADPVDSLSNETIRTHGPVIPS
jgi:hypothetical protein